MDFLTLNDLHLLNQYSGGNYGLSFKSEERRGSLIWIFEPPKGTEIGWKKSRALKNQMQIFLSKGAKNISHKREARKIRVVFSHFCNNLGD